MRPHPLPLQGVGSRCSWPLCAPTLYVTPRLDRPPIRPFCWTADRGARIPRVQNGYVSSGTSGHPRPLRELKHCLVSSENVPARVRRARVTLIRSTLAALPKTAVKMTRASRIEAVEKSSTAHRRPRGCAADSGYCLRSGAGVGSRRARRRRDAELELADRLADRVQWTRCRVDPASSRWTRSRLACWARGGGSPKDALVTSDSRRTLRGHNRKRGS